MKKTILAAIMIIISSCSDIMDTESNIASELLIKRYSAKDSLNVLQLNNLDFGNIKFGTKASKTLALINPSEKLSVKIWKIETTNNSGLFEYTFPAGFPFVVEAGENTALTNKMEVSYIANDYSLSQHYDTLYFNDVKDTFLTIHAKANY